jgi:hypothetical protein
LGEREARLVPFVISIVYLCTLAPSRMAADLLMAGYRVWEALDISEVLFLCEQHKIDAVVIAPEVEDQDMMEAQVRHICLKLQSNTTPKDVMWELENLFGRQGATVQ